MNWDSCILLAQCWMVSLYCPPTCKLYRRDPTSFDIYPSCCYHSASNYCIYIDSIGGALGIRLPSLRAWILKFLWASCIQSSHPWDCNMMELNILNRMCVYIIWLTDLTDLYYLLLFGVIAVVQLQLCSSTTCSLPIRSHLSVWAKALQSSG